MRSSKNISLSYEYLIEGRKKTTHLSRWIREKEIRKGKKKGENPGSSIRSCAKNDGGKESTPRLSFNFDERDVTKTSSPRGKG